MNRDLSFTFRCDSLSYLPSNDSHRSTPWRSRLVTGRRQRVTLNLADESPLHVSAKGSDEFAISMSAISGQEFQPRRYSPSVLMLHVSGKRLVVNGSALQPLNARLLLHLLHEQSAASRNCGHRHTDSQSGCCGGFISSTHIWPTKRAACCMLKTFLVPQTKGFSLARASRALVCHSRFYVGDCSQACGNVSLTEGLAIALVF